MIGTRIRANYTSAPSRYRAGQLALRCLSLLERHPVLLGQSRRQLALMLARSRRVQLEAAPGHPHLLGVLELRQRRLEATLADVAPGAGDVRPDFDVHELGEQPLGRWIAPSPEVRVEDLLEDRFPGLGTVKQSHRRPQLHRVDLTEDVRRAAPVQLSEDERALDQSWSEHRVGKVRLGLLERRDRVPPGGRAVPEAGELREHEPHPVRPLAPRAQLVTHGLVDSAVVLGVNESLQAPRSLIVRAARARRAE